MSDRFPWTIKSCPKANVYAGMKRYAETTMNYRNVHWLNGGLVGEHPSHPFGLVSVHLPKQLLLFPSAPGGEVKP